MAITKYHLGCTEWSQKGWRGNFFTDDAKQPEFLSQYTSVFNTVEGNTTFYQIPKIETIERWKQQIPVGFKFCFKFHQSITHQKQLVDAKDDILAFLQQFEPISDCLGPFMIQLPPQFSPDQFSQLETALSVLPAHHQYGVEVRHPGFFDQSSNESRLDNLLESYHVDRIIFDTRKLFKMPSNDTSIREAQRKKPQVPTRFITTGPHPMIRFVGANDPQENLAYLKEWAIIIADWIKEGRHPYVFIHAPDHVSQPKIAHKFHQLLSELIEIEPLPKWPSERQNEQLDLF